MNLTSLEAYLHRSLPPDHQSAAPELAHLLWAAVEKTLSPEQIQERLSTNLGLVDAVRRLAGQQVTTNSAVITFGAGAQAGDITISGDVAGGSIIKFTINIVVPPFPLASTLHQLRPPVEDFVGREQEIDKIVQAIKKIGSATISGVRGMGGIGKTELAYVIANKMKDTFPDGQIVIELLGTSSSPLTPEQALQIVIRSFDREAKVPEDLNELQRIYRSVLTGKRVLIVADDAEGAKQIRPLLPPEGCSLLVTSRKRFSLAGMVTIDLKILPPIDAEKLLLGICPRIGQNAGELAKLCEYLPLALRVSAGLLKENESREIERYLEQLRVERLKSLIDPDNADDPQSSVEASLRLSFKSLARESQWAFCKLSLYPLNLRQEWAKKIVWPEPDAQGVLELLQRCNLLEWNSVEGTLSMHVLVRLFGAERYIEIAEKEIKELNRQGNYLEEIKHIQLLAYAYGIIGNTTKAKALTNDVIKILRSFENKDDELGELMIFGDSYWLQKNWDVALVCYDKALEIARQTEDKKIQARMLWRIAWIHQEQKQLTEAIEYYENSLLLTQYFDDTILENEIRIGLMRAYLATGKIKEFNDLPSRIAEIKGREDNTADIMAEARRASEDAIKAITSK